MYEPDGDAQQTARRVLAETNALLMEALALVLASPDQTGQVLIVIDHGRAQYIKPQPSLRNNSQATAWLRQAQSPFE